MQLSRCVALLVWTVGSIGPALWAQSEQKGIDAIAAYAGVWKTHIDHLDTPYSKKGQQNATLKNDCWRSGAYFACRQIVDGDPKVLLVFTCKDDHSCTSYQIPPGGGTPGSGALELAGSAWTFPWSVTENGKTIQFRVVNVWSSPTAIEFRQEFSADGQHWTPMATGHEVKLADK
jgi:hypothetical protein